MKEVRQLEEKVAEFYGAKYAIATDCCTHAIELCLRLQDIKSATSPKHTYLSVPMTLEKLGIAWKFTDTYWKDYYRLGNTNIIDAAVYWKQDSYIPDTFMCLSFQYRKHLNLGRGGMILTDDYEAAIDLKKMSYDGRVPDVLWAEQDVDMLGYHYYMTPETAQLGLDKIKQAKETLPKQWSYKDYPDISKMKVFNVK
jgi:dTDP-4-amino-4,6-dideoxygalactose transaminase